VDCGVGKIAGRQLLSDCGLGEGGEGGALDNIILTPQFEVQVGQFKALLKLSFCKRYAERTDKSL
jgi:hypothetical protein